MVKQKPLAEKVTKFIPVPESGCWLWTGCVDRDGYGRLRGLVDNKPWFMFAHRASYLVHRGEIKNDLHVLHRCDVPSCINPDHLYLGTHQDNMRDRNDRNPTIVTDSQRREISKNNKRDPQPHDPRTGRFVSRERL